MACAPPLELRIGRRGAWRGGVGLLTALSRAAVLAWWSAQPDPAPGWAGTVAWVVCAGALACGAGLALGQPAAVLRWDRRQWTLARDGRPGETGDLGVAIDLGNWMLLRFVPAGGRGFARARWIAVQRRGLEARWHVLRCTVYAPGSQAADPS